MTIRDTTDPNSHKSILYKLRSFSLVQWIFFIQKLSSKTTQKTINKKIPIHQSKPENSAGNINNGTTSGSFSIMIYRLL